MIDFLGMPPEKRFEAACRDDILNQIVPSDIRGLLSEIATLSKKIEVATSCLSVGGDEQ
ncbi:MAG: hypothetical protein JKY34_11295 [Kordiimonadaceae bacterium]|nr:hypothetical protein [Kordiimonadaceae bacterium]